MSKYSKLIKQIIFFGIIGVGSLLVDLLVTTSLYNIFLFPAYLASGIGFLSAFFFNFPMNRKKVFHHTDQDRFNLKTQVALYVALCLFNLLMTAILTEIIVVNGRVDIALAKIIITGMIAVWNFCIFKLFIFSKRNVNSELP